MEKDKKTIREVALVDILNKLPEIIPLNCEEDFRGDNYDLFFSALGFEERCLTIPERLSNLDDFGCKRAIYFEYSTNTDDNEVNKPRLMNALHEFADSVDFLRCDTDDFTKNLRTILAICSTSEKIPKIMLDISVCSSKLIISIMKVFLDFDIYLEILYSEAETYHPTPEEFAEESDKWTSEGGFGIARGVGNIIPSPEYPGANRENPNIIIAFPTFKPERTKAITTYIDEAITMRPGKRIIWIVGDPNMDSKARIERKKMIREINKIPEDAVCYEVSTLDYKKQLRFWKVYIKIKIWTFISIFLH